MQLSPKEVLDRQTVTEIKTYLVNTDATIKGIAGELHFNDVSYMCRYFRKITGMSPIDFRKGSNDETNGSGTEGFGQAKTRTCHLPLAAMSRTAIPLFGQFYGFLACNMLNCNFHHQQVIESFGYFRLHAGFAMRILVRQ